jgi:hypothetical protein
MRRRRSSITTLSQQRPVDKAREIEHKKNPPGPFSKYDDEIVEEWHALRIALITKRIA